MPHTEQLPHSLVVSGPHKWGSVVFVSQDPGLLHGAHAGHPRPGPGLQGPPERDCGEWTGELGAGMQAGVQVGDVGRSAGRDVGKA